MLDPLTTVGLLSVVVFAIALYIGYRVSDTKGEAPRSKLQVIIAIVVTMVWIITIAAEIVIPTYSVSVLVHGIMGAVVGYLFSNDGLTINIGGE